MSTVAARLLMMIAAATLTIAVVLGAVFALDEHHQKHPRPAHFDE